MAVRLIARALDKGTPQQRNRSKRLHEILALVATPPASDDLVATLNLAKFGIPLASELKDAAAEATLRGLAASVHATLGHYSRATIYAESALRLAQGARLEPVQTKAHATLSYAFGELGEGALSRHHSELATEQVSSITSRTVSALVAGCVALDLCRAKDLKTAVRFVDHALTQCTLAMDLRWSGPLQHVGAIVALEAGQMEIASIRLKQAEETLTMFPSRRLREEIRLTQLEMALRQGDDARARDLIDRMPLRFEALRMSHRALRAAEIASQLNPKDTSSDSPIQADAQLKRAQQRYDKEQLFQQRWLLKQLREKIAAQALVAKHRDQSLSIALRDLDRKLMAPDNDGRSALAAAE